jgi:heme A synthase
VALVPFAGCEVAIVVLLLVCGGWVEQLAGSAIVNGDPRRPWFAPHSPLLTAGWTRLLG